MTKFVDLEIGIRRDGDHYAVELRCIHPDSETDVRSGYSLVQFDAAELLERSIDDAEYGTYLTEQLFANSGGATAGPTPQAIFVQARGIAQSRGVPLRLRLFIGPNASELHNLCWERLCDPEDGTALLTDATVLFSRYLSSLDWRPVHLRRKTALRAMVVVANPDLSEYPDLEQIEDVGHELSQVESTLEDVSITALASEGSASLAPEYEATFQNIRNRLRHEEYDIVYLVCHGTLDKGESTLWLEDGIGNVDMVSGHRLATMLRKLPSRPRLVVLASCQTGGSGEGAVTNHARALTALGPRLAEAGIPAVIAMQGNVAMETASDFMSKFFEELHNDEPIDRAMAAARSEVEDPLSDWWRPALFMRLRSGRVWYTPGFASDQQELEIWTPLLDAIEGDEDECYCTPILGPDLADSLLGSRREIARRWAEDYQFPMAYHHRADLSQVAQYLAVHWKAKPLRNRLRKDQRQELVVRHGEELRAHLGDDLPGKLHELVEALVSLDQEPHPAELYRALARFPFPIYITADPSGLLEKALAVTKVNGVQKEPQHKLCPWKDDIEPELYELDRVPSPEHPLVYYLFGSFREPDSLVLTEDDYYDFLIGMARNRDLIPPVVRSALAKNVLLFLGFRIADRGFRVLLRSIMNQEGRSGAEVTSVVAQVHPEEGYIQEAERACRYLEKYFQKAAINSFWGSAEDFVGELKEHWRERGGET